MAYVRLKRGKWFARVKGDKAPNKWSEVTTGYPESERAAALEYAKEAQRAIDERNARGAASELLTLSAWAQIWLPRREQAGLDWKKDRSRLQHHVLPVLGDRDIRSVVTADISDLVHELRFTKQLAARTVRNVYSVLAAAMRDAAIAGKIPTSPCTLTKLQLGSVLDKHPEWRAGALYTREEAQQMISDPRIPLDRQVTYGFGLLAGLRPGEAGALRWRHYELDKTERTEQLNRLSVALSYSTTYSKTKRTKTETTKIIPVHPTLAAMLDEWRGAWEVMFGRAPGPEDLIIPLPPDVKRTRRTGERFRGWDYTGRKWREVDEPLLGWRHRSVYDTKATFITLAIDDGADPDVIRDRVTHTKPRRGAFDGYDRGPHWIETCREVRKLRLERRVTTMCPPSQGPGNASSVGSGGGFRTHDADTETNTKAQQASEIARPLMTACDWMFAIWSHERVTTRNRRMLAVYEGAADQSPPTDVSAIR